MIKHGMIHLSCKIDAASNFSNTFAASLRFYGDFFFLNAIQVDKVTGAPRAFEFKLW